MKKHEKIRKILNIFSDRELKWNFSDDWISKIEKRCGNNLTVANVRGSHNSLISDLAQKVTAIVKTKGFAKRIDVSDIENFVWEKIQKTLNPDSNYNPKYAEVTYVSNAVENLLKNEIRRKAKKHTNNDSNGVDSVIEHQVLTPTFLNDIQELDGDEHLAKFLKNISISSYRKFTEEEDLRNFKLKINGIDRTVFYDDLGNKYNPGKYSFVPNFFKYQTICETPHRIEMFKARDLVEESKSNFHKTVIQPLKNQGDYKSALHEEEKTPVLSAVALDKYGDVIKTAYKGQCGEMKHHCEFTLFESVFDTEDWNKIKGGTVYVTLEPCHKRGIDSDTGKAKIPCAVRCLESGIDSIYIAHHDPDESVKGHGIKTLETGQYTFKKDNGILSINGFRDLDSVLALKKYFEDKGYKKVVDNDESLVYQVGKPVKVNLFHTDIALQIMKINKSFLKNKFPEAYISTSLV